VLQEAGCGCALCVCVWGGGGVGLVRRAPRTNRAIPALFLQLLHSSHRNEV
jgi:hypothetical protein